VQKARKALQVADLWNKVTLYMDLPEMVNMSEISVAWANAFSKQLSKPHEGYVRYCIEVDLLTMTSSVRQLKPEEIKE
jgi:hypothetical protein